MIQLRKLQVSGFRGIRNEIEIDFGTKYKSLILSGSNGSGKSSFVDAVEWLLTGRIEHLAREGCGDLAYRHRLLPMDQPARVSIITGDQEICGGRLLDGARRAELTEKRGPLAQFLERACSDTVILRYGQMRNFVDKTKTEKLYYLSGILGLKAVSELRDELSRTSGSLKRDESYRYLLSQIKDYESRLCRATGLKKFDEDAAFALAERLRQDLKGLIPIVDGASLQASVDELMVSSQRDHRARAIMESRRYLADLEPVLDEEETARQIVELANGIAVVRADKTAVDQLALAALYETGKEVIDRQVGDTHTCPLCGQEVNRQALADHLCAQLAAISQIVDRLERLNAVRHRLAKTLGEWQIWLTRVRTIAPGLGISEGERLAETAQAAFDLIGRWADSLRSEGDPLPPLPAPSPEDLSNLRSFTDARAEAAAALQKYVRQLEGSEAEKEHYDRLEKLEQIARDLVARRRACMRQSHFERQIQTMERAQALCEQAERRALEHTLSIISEDVNRYYLKLHPDEGFDQIRLWTTEARGVEFEFTFHGDRISPPGQLMSESHLNTLGICLFLASARHFNQHTRFLFLDDVINSVDAGHRNPLARLLRDEFNDFQLVLLTHDQMWVDILRRTAPDWLTKAIASWSYEQGVSFRDSPANLEMEARDLVRQGYLAAAGNTARQWLERVLKARCNDMEVGLAFRYNDRNEERMPGELLPALRKHMERTEIFKANSALFQDLEASQFIGSRLSHDNAYASSPPQPIDIDLFLNDVRRLDTLFLCPECHTYIAAKHTPASASRKQCKCGSLELK